MPSAVDLHFPELTTLIEEWWRGTHDPGVPPHITLLYPWVDLVTEVDLDKVRQIASSTRAFDMVFAGVDVFTAGAVYLRPEPEKPIRALMAALAHQFPESPLYGGEIADPVPHLTIARATPGAAVTAMLERISVSLASRLPLAVSVVALTVMEQRSDGSWRTLIEFPLGRP